MVGAGPTNQKHFSTRASYACTVCKMLIPDKHFSKAIAAFLYCIFMFHEAVRPHASLLFFYHIDESNTQVFSEPYLGD